MNVAGAMKTARTKSLFSAFSGFNVLRAIQGAAGVIAGATIIDAAFAVITSIAMDQFIEIVTARPKLLASISQAQQPVNLGALLVQQNGEDLAAYFWAKALDTTEREDAQVLAKAAAAQKIAAANNYALPE